MPASFVRQLFAGTPTGSTNTPTITPAANATAGDTIILAFGGAAVVTVTGVTDTKGNTWTVDVTAQQSTSNARNLAICSTRQDVGALTTTDTITVTTDLAVGTGGVTAWVEEFSGQYVIDVSATSAGLTTPITTGTTATTASADAFAVAAFRTSKSGATATWAWTKDANYTNFTTAPPLPTGSVGVSSAAHYRILTATGTQSATDTVSATINGYLGAIVVYKPSTGGAIKLISGTASGSTAVSATVVRTRALSATSSGRSTVTASVVRGRVLGATSTGSTAASAVVVRTRTVSVTVAGSTTSSATLVRTRAISAAATGSTTTTAALVRTRTVSATSTGSTAVSAAVTAGAITFAATSSGSTAVSATVVRVRAVTTSANGSTTVTVGLVRTRVLTATANGTTSVAAILTVPGSGPTSVDNPAWATYVYF